MINSVSEMALLWDKALKKIEQRLGEKQLFDSFFAGSYINNVYGNVIEVVANSDLAVTLMSNKYIDIISEIINELTESNFKLVFATESDVKKKKDEGGSTLSKVNYFKDSSINPLLTFDNFVVGKFNREACQASVLIASNPGKMYNPLFIFSNPGLGKTHLLQSISNYIQKTGKPGSKILYVTANNFIDEYVKYVRGEKEAESLKDYICGFDAFLIDDVQMLSKKVHTQEMFFSIYEYMINNGKQIVMTSDKQPNEIPDMDERLISRMYQGLVVKINDPDQETCVEILKKKIVSSGLDLSCFDDDVLFFFADKFSRNIRELSCALNRLIYTGITLKQSKHITMDIALESVESISSSKELSSQINEQKIINVVADYYNLPPYQITGKIRTGQIALARHVAMYLIRYSLDVPLKKIGDTFGGKDHTTVMSAISKVDEMLKHDDLVKQAISDLKKRLNLK